jgi:copper transport protein
VIARSAIRSGTGTRIVACVLALVGGLLVAGLIWAPAASAHAVLVSSSPVDGSRVNSEPAEVRLTFDESVGLIPAAEEVISTTGLRADTGQPRLAAGGTTIVLPLRPGLPKGTYSATWRVVSADTHVVSGSITFGLGVSPGAGVTAPADHTRGLDVAADVAQGLIYAGIVALIGVLAAIRLLWPWGLGQRRVQLLAWAGWAALLAGTAVTFLLQGPRAADGSWHAVARFQDAGLTLDSVFGAHAAGRRRGHRAPVDRLRGVAGGPGGDAAHGGHGGVARRPPPALARRAPGRAHRIADAGRGAVAAVVDDRLHQCRLPCRDR